jgi:hypothetical protein
MASAMPNQYVSHIRFPGAPSKLRLGGDLDVGDKDGGSAKLALSPVEGACPVHHDFG